MVPMRATMSRVRIAKGVMVEVYIVTCVVFDVLNARAVCQHAILQSTESGR